jgi:hypothetical protein
MEDERKLFEGIELISAAYTSAAKRHDNVVSSLRRELTQATEECAALRARDAASSAQNVALAERVAALERDQRRLAAENAQLTAQVRHFEARAAKLESFRAAVMSTFELDDVTEKQRMAFDGAASSSAFSAVPTHMLSSSSSSSSSSSLSQLLSRQQQPPPPQPRNPQRHETRFPPNSRMSQSAPFSSYLPANLTPADLDGPQAARHAPDPESHDDEVARTVDTFIAHARATLPLESLRLLLELIEHHHPNASASARQVCRDPETLRLFDAVLDAVSMEGSRA